MNWKSFFAWSMQIGCSNLVKRIDSIFIRNKNKYTYNLLPSQKVSQNKKKVLYGRFFVASLNYFRFEFSEWIVKDQKKLVRRIKMEKIALNSMVSA